MILYEFQLKKLTLEEFSSYIKEELKKVYLKPLALDIATKERMLGDTSCDLEELEALRQKYDELQMLELEELRDLGLEKRTILPPGSDGWRVLVEFIINKGGEYNNFLQYILDCETLVWGKRHVFLNELLSKAVWYGNMEAFLLLFADDRVDPSFDHNRAIRYAAQKGRTEMVTVLLTDERVDPSDGGPPRTEWVVYNPGIHGLYVEVPRPPNQVLTRVVQHGDVELVKTLLADPRVSGKSIDNALSEVKDEEIKAMLLAVRTNSGLVETYSQTYERFKREAFYAPTRTHTHPHFFNGF